MAKCYICGKNYAEYRRTVSTGSSNRVYYSKRGMASSVSSNYGTRSVCASCALSIDYNNKKQSVGFIFFLSCGFLCIFGFIFGLVCSPTPSILCSCFLGTVINIVIAVLCKNSKE